VLTYEMFILGGVYALCARLFDMCWLAGQTFAVV